MKNLFALLLLVFVHYSLFAQNQTVAEQAVMDFMRSTYTDNHYEPVSFGAVSEQLHGDFIESLMNFDKKVNYSIRHTLIIDGITYIDEYFHLDYNYNVSGHCSQQDMMDVYYEILINSQGFKELLEQGIIDTMYLRIDSQ